MRAQHRSSASRLRRAIAAAFPNGRWMEPGRRHGVLIHRLRAPDGEGRPWPDADGGGFFLVDLETLGFLGRPVFMIGVLEPRGPRGARLVQYFARDYAEERDMIRSFLRRHGSRGTWVSFNGKAFDVPFLRDRCRYHRLTPPEPEAHIDLLHEARPVWRDVLPNCRLKTLESHVCGLWRTDDLDGFLVPHAYHAFVESGNPADIVRILQHNRHDLVTLGRLFRILRDPARAGERKTSPAQHAAFPAL